MKKLLLLFRFVPALAIIILFNGCFKDKLTKTYTIISAVYEDKAVILANVKGGAPKELKVPGKIYIRGNYLFINEVNKGVHVFDNSNPSSPKAVSFINIPGNLDIAVSGHYLYADMFTDMLTVDINDPLHATLKDTSANVFPERNYTAGWQYDNSKVLVGWVTKDTTVDIGPPSNSCTYCYALASSDMANFSKGTYIPGIAGSMARFSIVNNYLYTVNLSSLTVFNLDDESNPSRQGDILIGSNIETIFPMSGQLFVGSSTGMFMYNINDPAAPEKDGQFLHARACDPVVSDGKYAYVTLRSGTACQGTGNQLDIVDISNVFYPSFVKTYQLSNPHGLGKDGNLLFICDGSAGLKVYDATDVKNLQLIKVFADIVATDVIPWANKLIVVADNGLYQFDYSNRTDIKLLSTINIAK
jgi:hypothetical protein